MAVHSDVSPFYETEGMVEKNRMDMNGAHFAMINLWQHRFARRCGDDAAGCLRHEHGALRRHDSGRVRGPLWWEEDNFLPPRQQSATPLLCLPKDDTLGDARVQAVRYARSSAFAATGLPHRCYRPQEPCTATSSGVHRGP